MRSRPRVVRAVYLSKAGAGQLFLLTGAISPSAAVVGWAGWPLLAVPSYSGGRSGSHDWNLSRHPARSVPAAPRPHPSLGGPWNFRQEVTSVLMLRDSTGLREFNGLLPAGPRRRGSEVFLPGRKAWSWKLC
ncbi:hypothetical protein NN561_014431 [Cricetulus griseus]